MGKIKVEDMACFKQVAKVIGVSNAKRELFIALSRYEGEISSVVIENPLEASFIWRDTHQGYMFWKNIYDGIGPLSFMTELSPIK